VTGSAPSHLILAEKSLTWQTGTFSATTSHILDLSVATSSPVDLGPATPLAVDGTGPRSGGRPSTPASR
jgi:hypothetical protein